MAKERPQLDLNELQQLRWLLGGVVALIAIWSVWYLDSDAWPLLGLATVGTLVAVWRPRIPGKMPRWVHRLAFPAIVAAFVFDFYTFGQILSSLVRLAVMLLLLRAVTYRRRRDDLQLLLLALFLVVAAGVLTVSVGFALQIVAFAGCALGLLLTRGLVEVAGAGAESTDGSASSGPPAWASVSWRALFRRLAQVSDWRVWVFAGFLFATLVAVSAGLFLAIPRFQLESGLFLDRWMNRRTVTGFTDTLRFGEVSDIQKDESVAFRIEIADPRQLPPEPYWRMIVLDQYHDHGFRLSPELRQAAFGREVTEWRVPAFGFPDRRRDATQWTFYVEPGVSRYLPMLSDFRNLLFTEPQTFRASVQLRMIELSRDPSAMKAFRFDRGVMTDSVIDPLFERGTRYAGSRVLARTCLEVPFAPDERSQWLRAVAEITRGRTLSSAEFSEEAVRWLHARHTYSLKSTLPRGGTDPLTRWAFSSEPGHCELFAGAFTMLARSAGYPTRVVAGFLGGAWNGDYLIVRNSHAHAWCEIFDESGRWVRVDPTAPASGGRNREQDSDFRGLAEVSGWTAGLDRARMFWYRRIVNFDRRDQLNLVKALRATTENSGRQVRAWMDETGAKLRAWLVQPWGFGRALRIILPLALAAGAAWLWRRYGRDWWRGWRASRSRRADPVRREAGRWLVRLAAVRARGGEPPLEAAEVEAALLRLRYGAPESWSVPETVFRRAARLLRVWRRAARRPHRAPA